MLLSKGFEETGYTVHFFAEQVHTSHTHQRSMLHSITIRFLTIPTYRPSELSHKAHPKVELCPILDNASLGKEIVPPVLQK